MPENVTELVPQQPREPSQLLPLHSCIRIFRQKIEGDAAWISGVLMDASRDSASVTGYQ